MFVNSKISIIVPVYNVERYLERCLNSLINQTHKNLEIILIDDGSTDGSGKICDRYEMENKNVKVFHNSNKGVSNARNFGILKATGQYIGFVDADDFVDYNMFERLCNQMLFNNNIDISMCTYYKYDNVDNKKKEEDVISADNSLKYVISNVKYKGFVWNKLFKKNIIIDNHLKFNPKIDMGEDLLFCIEYLSYANQVAVLSDCLYHYEDRCDSISNIKFNEKRFTIIQAYDYILELNNVKNNNEILELLKEKQIIHEISLLVKLIISFNIDNRKKYTKEIIKRIKSNDIKKIKKSNLKYKVLFFIIKRF